jgi:hypothetical protein
MMLYRRSFLRQAVGVVAATLAAPAAALASTQPRIAIVASTENGDVQRSDTDRLVAQLGHGVLQHPHYQLVTRARLDAVLQEQGLSNSAYADPGTAAKLGRILGASHILHVTLSIDVNSTRGLVDHETVDASSDYEFIEVDTARIIANGSADGSDDREAPGGGQFSTSGTSSRRTAIDACANDVIAQLSLR